MKIEYDHDKERSNLKKHGLDFSFAPLMFDDPLAVVVEDTSWNGEERWRLFAEMGNVLLLVVFSYPDPDDEERVRVIGLRKAVPSERHSYEEGQFD